MSGYGARMRAPSVAGLLRVTGLAGTLVGCGIAVASLSETWAVETTADGTPVDRTGWEYLSYGDVAIVAGCALVAVLAVALCAGPRSRKVSRTAGGAAVGVLLLGLAGVGVVYWLTGLDLDVFGADDAPSYDAASGFLRAAIGLGVAAVGVMVLLAGRWETRTRRALARDAPPAEPSWLTAQHR